ncbi:STAS domain-containing protein [Streptomyces sp. T-3]|nr:STAS domain-containing protein [Streptomyces sp. T-3]
MEAAAQGQAPGSRLRITRTATEDGFVTVVLAGELDPGTLGALRDVVSGVFACHGKQLILDLTQINRCDDASLHALLGISQALRLARINLTLISPSQAVQQALDRTGLGDLLPLAALGREGPSEVGRDESHS